jgi:hypothetical protein
MRFIGGFMAGSLGLIVLYVALNNSQNIGTTTNVAISIMRHAMSPEVPAIPDLRQK